MRLYRYGGLLAVAAFAACVGDSPTGVDTTGPQTVDGVRIHEVADVGTYALERAMVVDERLECELIDFEELEGGLIGPAGGVVQTSVFGQTVDMEITEWTDDLPNDCGTGSVLIFDTDGPPYDDNDLVLAGQSVTPNLGNVATHQSCQTAYPNDADVQDVLLFTFPVDDWYVSSFAALDQEGPEGEQIGLRVNIEADNTTVGQTDVAADNADAVEIVMINPAASFNETLAIDFNGSGAIDNLEICRIVERGGEGCTPGYWKQPQHFGNWPVDIGYTFADAFDGFCDTDDVDLRNPESGTICGLTLLEALGTRGGGVNALARHAAAAWLNAGSTVDFYYSQEEVESMVEAALMSGDYETVKDGLAEANEAGCPLGRAELDD